MIEPECYKFKLNNGLKLLFIPIKNELISINLRTSIGEDNEVIGTKDYEIVHTLEHLFGYFTSKKYPNGTDNINNLSKLGIEINAHVTETETNFNMKGNKKHFELIVDYLYNTFAEFKLDTNILNSEKQSIKQELNEIINETWYNLELKMHELLFSNHIRSISQVLKKNNLKNLTSQRIYNFYKRKYSPSNTCLTVCGGINKKMLEIVKKKFSNIEKKNVVVIPRNIGEFKQNISFSKTESVSYNINLIFKIDCNMFQKRHYIYELISFILTDNLDSNLYRALRRKGLIYSINSYILTHPKRTDFSFFIINTETVKSNVKKVIQIILKELNSDKTITDNKIFIKNKIELEYNKNNNESKIDYYSDLYTNQYLWNHNIVNNKDIFNLRNKITETELIKCLKNLNLNNLIINYGGKQNLNSILKIINI